MKGDDGAIAVIVAIMLVALLGIGTIVVDVGSLYAERRQLQNGADAAALAVAIDCVKTTCNGSSTALAMATAQANANANDNATTVTEVCGTATPLSACSPASPAGSWDCPGQPTSGPMASAKYVQVRTQTLNNGTSVMPPIFAKVLEPGYTGSTVKACARVAFGAASAGSTLAMTISLCDWAAATANGTSYAPAPPYPPNPSSSFERIIYLHTTTTQTCPGGPSGSDVPGGFGWLNDPAGTCSTYIDVNNTYGDNTGVSVSEPCKTALSAAYAGKYVVYVPVFDSVTGTGTNGVYHLKGFAAFVVTGYHLPGFSQPSWLTGKNLCTGSDKCLYGFFTQGLVPAGSLGGSSMGAIAIRLTG
jgi:Putative Flp pilus-assembly TadE/G-like